jgi:hypothetical protein
LVALFGQQQMVVFFVFFLTDEKCTTRGKYFSLPNFGVLGRDHKKLTEAKRSPSKFVCKMALMNPNGPKDLSFAVAICLFFLNSTFLESVDPPPGPPPFRKKKKKKNLRLFPLGILYN